MFFYGVNTLPKLLVVWICSTLINGAQEFDISDVVFQDSASFAGVCIQDYPSNITVLGIGATSVTIGWEPLTDETGITGYQVLYWEASSTLYRNVSVGVVDQYTLVDLKPLDWYYVSVRGVCPSEQGYTIGALPQELVTRSTFPSETPTIQSVVPTYSSNTGESFVIIDWSPISDDQWNGVMLNYVIVMADITTRPVQQTSFLVGVGDTSLRVNALMVDHSYLVTISANSSGGVGMASAPRWFVAEGPPETPTEPNYVNYWYYAAVPAGIVLALLVILFIILCKVQYERKKRKVQFARNISTNIDEHKFPVGSDFEPGMRMDSVRMSNRPLPAQPQPSPRLRTPSVSSMNARLIDQTSPNQFQRGPSFSAADHHFHQPHHPAHPPPPPSAHSRHPNLPPLELDPNVDHQGGWNRSVTSPPVPQLSQPLSDLSSATPSSVFTESNVPHPDEVIAASSPNNPKEYEIPSESKTCHQSVSPDVNHHTLPNPRRPHTATGVGASQPALSRHHPSSHSPVSLTHSSTDVRSVHPFSSRPPDVPPHRGNPKNHAPLHHTQEEFPMYTRPESGLYSEIPNEDPRFSNKVAPPIDHAHTDPQFNDYSDIPEVPETGRPHLPSVGEYRHQGDILSSDSMSSFSTDSQASSPAHSKMGADVHHLSRINSGRSGVAGRIVILPEEDGDHDYDEANSIITDNSVPVSSVNGTHGSSNGSDTNKDPIKPNPYLSPVDLVPSSNGHTPSD